MSPVTPPPETSARTRGATGNPRRLIPGAGLIVVLLLLIVRPPVLRPGSRTPGGPGAGLPSRATLRDGPATAALNAIGSRRPATAAERFTNAAKVVAMKLTRFGQSRRDLARALAARRGINVPAEAERFFDAVESGNWDEITTAFNAISGGDSSAGHSGERAPEVSALWPAIIDAYGAAEQVHLWPPAQLLEYGTAILDSLRPGMVYVGGTDHGRWIPELLNDTSDGERHLVLTQNGLADNSYLEYLRLQYQGSLALPSEDDAARIFQAYIADVTQRQQHDQQSPDEPPQIRPGENVKVQEGRVEVGGSGAVMAINEKLLQLILERNAGLGFALEESQPLRATYPEARPLGPLMELGAGSGSPAFDADRAAQTVAYWRDATDRLMTDTESTGSPDAMKAWSHDAGTAANLLASHQFIAEAEQAFQLARRLSPENRNATLGLAELYDRSGRAAEARALLESVQPTPAAQPPGGGQPDPANPVGPR